MEETKESFEAYLQSFNPPVSLDTWLDSHEQFPNLLAVQLDAFPERFRKIARSLCYERRTSRNEQNHLKRIAKRWYQWTKKSIVRWIVGVISLITAIVLFAQNKESSQNIVIIMMFALWGVALTRDLFVVLAILLFPLVVISWFVEGLVGTAITAIVYLCITFLICQTSQKKVEVIHHPKPQDEARVSARKELQV